MAFDTPPLDFSFPLVCGRARALRRLFYYHFTRYGDTKVVKLAWMVGLAGEP